MDKAVPVLAENEIDPMEALVKEANADRDKALKERDRAVAERDFARKQGCDLANRLKAEREIYGKALHRANGRAIRSIRFPFILFLAFAGLALVVGILVKGGLVSQLLGEPLTYGCICVCSFFGGIVWSRTEGRGRKK